MPVATWLHILGTEEWVQQFRQILKKKMVEDLVRAQIFLGLPIDVGKGGHSCCLCWHLLPYIYPETSSSPLLPLARHASTSP